MNVIEGDSNSDPTICHIISSDMDDAWVPMEMAMLLLRLLRLSKLPTRLSVADMASLSDAKTSAALAAWDEKWKPFGLSGSGLAGRGETGALSGGRDELEGKV